MSLVFPLKRPRYVPKIRKIDDKEKEIFKKQVKSKIIQGKTEVMFYDEAFFKRETTLTRGWYIKGSKPEIINRKSRDKVGIHSAISLSGRLFSLIFNEFNSDTFIEYLKALISGSKKKITLILDNASPHKSKKVIEFVARHKRKINLLYLPPYSPDLNPQEGVWKDIRYSRTHNIYFKDYLSLEDTLIDYLKEFSVPNEKLAGLCKTYSCV
jgi:transposase